jgi:hypothetical protein
MRFFRLKTSPVDFCNVFDTRAHPASCRPSLAKTTRGRLHAWSPTDARCVDVLCTPMSHALLRLQLALQAATEMARVCREPIRRSEGALRLSEGAPPRSASSILRRALTHMLERILLYPACCERAKTLRRCHLAKGNIFEKAKMPSTATEPLREREGKPSRARPDQLLVTPFAFANLARRCSAFVTPATSPGSDVPSEGQELDRSFQSSPKGP